MRDESLAQRFLREARVAGSLNHPNVVTVYDFLEQDGVPYIAMEYLDGGSLRPWVGRTSPAQTAGALEGLLAALSHAESMGIVHRDVKPENLLVTADGAVKIADFGIAKAYQHVATEEMLTPAGATVGTPAYMAPEQAMAQELGPWTDLYQAGVVAYELLAGRAPFTADGEPVRSDDAAHQRSGSAASGGTDPALEAWVRSMLAKEPSARPPGASAAWDELEEIVVRLLGPLWRRDARLGDARPDRRAPAPVDAGAVLLLAGLRAAHSGPRPLRPRRRRPPRRNRRAPDVGDRRRAPPAGSSRRAEAPPPVEPPPPAPPRPSRCGRAARSARAAPPAEPPPHPRPPRGAARLPGGDGRSCRSARSASSPPRSSRCCSSAAAARTRPRRRRPTATATADGDGHRHRGARPVRGRRGP